jgi:hypothetical protein
MLINYYYKYKIVTENLKYLKPIFSCRAVCIKWPDSAVLNDAPMWKKIPVLFLACLGPIQSSWNQAPIRKDYFRPPLDIPIYLSGNFGEIRSNHFHSGIDIKTQGVTGHRVFACAGGYVSRIKIESAGYGNTLYITHPAGYTTVYAHLERFRDDIAGYVKTQQYAKRQHAMNIYPGREDFPVKKGDLIAFTGNSGYSFGPHLHFEIRDAASQEPMNVLRFGFDIEDLVPPRIFSLYVYSENPNGLEAAPLEKRRFDVVGKNGQYRLQSGDTLKAGGKIGFGIEAFDYLNGAHNRCGIYRIHVLVDGMLKYHWVMNRFSFSKTRYVNSYMDYEEKFLNSRVIQKTFLDPNNRLDLYRYVEQDGMHDFSGKQSHHVRIVLEDVYENRSELEFFVRGGQTDTPEKAPESQPAEVFRCSGPNEFKKEGIEFNLPAGALYTDLRFEYATLGKEPGTYSSIHSLHHPSTPIHLPCELRIKPVGLPENMRDKALIVCLGQEEEIVPAGGEWKDGMLSASIREFGKYFITIDTLPPEIRPVNLRENTDTLRSNSIRFHVSDAISGIKSYEGYIDNEWVLFEYDLKNDLVFYRLDPERLSGKRDHEIELYIIDNSENIAYYYAQFYW